MDRLKIVQKQRLIRFAFIAALFAVAFFLPSEASAETIQQTLRDNETIKELHRGLLNIVNIPIILLIVVIAFSEMLRLKIDTYGFKKVLPTLVLAIIAAQFSYLFCKLVIDAANMTITLFTDPNLLSRTFGEASTLPSKYSRTFEGLFPTPPDWASFTYDMFFGILLKVVFLLIGSVLLLVLCFLFLVRTWMIYFLVIISPVALMALALPQTKTYFNKWWSEFVKWTFMPIPSIFFLWLGVTVLDNPIVTGSWLETSIISVIIAAICLYAAIRVPFKLGGGIMDKFWQYSGAKWGLGKAKSKWLDPAVQYWKDRSMVWWHNQAQGSQSKLSPYNPIGAIARRGLRVEDDRKDMSELVKTSKEGAVRWAYGGKPVAEYYETDPVTGEKKLRFKYKFFSDKGRLKKAQLMDSVKSDMGEYDYIRKQLDLDWKLNTEEGRNAVGRSVAYGMRSSGVDNWHKALAMDAEAMAYSEEELDKNGKPKNWFLSNTSFGIVAGDRHWQRQKELFVTSQEKLDWSSDLVSKKMKNDRIKFDYQPAATLTMLKEEINSLEKNTESQIEGTQANKDLKAAIGRWERAIETIRKDDRLFKDGKFSSNAITLKAMLTDQNGNFIGNDYKKAQSLTKLWGYDDAPSDLRNLFISRLRKATSIIAKEEVTSEAGKRIPIESAKRAVEKFETQLEDMFAGMQAGVWTNDYKDAFGALKNSLVNARDENAPIIYGMYVEMLKKIASDPEATDEMKQNALEIMASGQRQSMRTSLQQSTIMENVLVSSAREVLGITDDTVWKGMDSSEKAEKMSSLRKDRNYRIKVQEKLQEQAAKMTRQNADDLEKVLKVKFDEHGQVHVFVDTTSDTALAAELLGNMNAQAVNFNEREKGNAEGQQRLSTVAGLTAAMPTAKEAITFFEEQISNKERKKKRKRKKEEKDAFDAINT